MTRFLIFLFLGITLHSTTSLGADNFEGVIEYQKTENSVVTRHIFFYVSGKRIRVEIFASGEGKEETVCPGLFCEERDMPIPSYVFLFDLDSGTTRWLNYNRLLWDYNEPNKISCGDTSKYAVRNTGRIETSTISGYLCHEEKVIAKNDSSTVVFWMTSGNYTFFKPMMDLYQIKEFFGTFFCAILTNASGELPVRIVKSYPHQPNAVEIELVKAEVRSIDARLFEIPCCFRQFGGF